MHPTYYRSFWHVVSWCFLARYCQISSLATVVYNPKAVFPHAVSLRQTFVHCAKFPVAATRRCRFRVSVTLWPIMLSHRLAVVGLVSHYLTNYLIARRLLQKRPKSLILRSHAVLPHLSVGYPPLLGKFLRVTHPSATLNSPKGVYRSTCMPKAHRQRSS